MTHAMSSSRHALALFVLLAAAAPPAVAAPEDPGPFDYAQVTQSLTVEGQLITFDLFLTSANGPGPALVLAHGFQRSKANLAGWGAALAQRGYVAVAPDFTGGFAPDHAFNGRVVSALLDWLLARNDEPGHPLYGRIDATRLGLLGHSAGGLASLLAAAARSDVKALVALDPVDNGGLALAAAPSITAPTLFLLATPGPCNAEGNATAVFAALTAPRLSLRVVDATHCDAEDPSDALCGFLCGAADATRQARFRRYAFAALDYLLLCDETLALWLGGAEAQGDPLIRDLEAHDFPPLVCQKAKDGGAPVADAAKDQGAVDAGAKDVGSEDTTFEDARSAADSRSGNAGGCQLGSSSSPRTLLWCLALVGLLWAGRRRRGALPLPAAQPLRRQ